MLASDGQHLGLLVDSLDGGGRRVLPSLLLALNCDLELRRGSGLAPIDHYGGRH